MNHDSHSAPKIDPTKASVARVYDYLLGGKDHFAIDREMGDNLKVGSPDVVVTARMIKDFGARATDYIARQGVRQFVDLGSGLPTTPPSVHDTARAVLPDVTVVYVDYDPIVVAHSRALRDIGPGLTTILADIEDPESILEHPELLGHIDFAEPVAILIISVLQTVASTRRAHDIMREFTDRLVPGSHLALAHVSTNSAEAAKENANHSADRTGYPRLAFRDDQEVLTFFDGFELAEPGLVDIQDWRPSPGSEGQASPALSLRGAVGRKRDR